MRRWWMPGGLTVSIIALAALLRLAFIWFAPRELSGDAYHYHLSAIVLAQGGGYTDIDGSPSIRWMPGWPFLLAAFYQVFGIGSWAPMIFNALAGASTTAILIRLGGLLWRPRCGWIAGALYACWPGNVYFSATLMTESVFNLSLMLCLWALVEAGFAAQAKRSSWIAAGGAMFACLVMIKAEPLVLLPVAIGLVATASPRGTFRRNAVVFLALGSILLIPWTVRNYRAFDRIVVTTAMAGANAWLGNHAGASGGQSIVEMRAFMKEHQRANRAQTLFEASRVGRERVARFVREDPVEALSVLARKLWLTYGSDASAVRLVRGVGVGRVGFISERAMDRLSAIANLYWAAMAVLVGMGLLAARKWSRPAQLVCLGVPCAYLAVHLAFLGGPRFHAPEVPAFALIAATALDRWIPGPRVRRQESAQKSRPDDDREEFRRNSP